MPGPVGGGRATSGSQGLTWAFEGAGELLLAAVVLAALAIALWWHARPCSTCGEFRAQCRCRPPEYPPL